MEESLREAQTADDWRVGYARRLHDQRQRAREQVDAQRERLRELESRFTEQLDAAARELTQDQQESQQEASRESIQIHARESELARRERELDDRRNELARVEQEAARRQTELERRTAEVEARQGSLDRAEQDLTRRRTELDATRAAQAADADRLAGRDAELRQLRADLTLQQHQVVEREKETLRQRRLIAQQLRAKKKELAAQIEMHRSEALSSGAGQDLQLQMRLSELQGQYERMREDLALREMQRDEATHRAAELKGQLEGQQSEIAHQRESLETAQRRAAALEGERHRVTDLEAQLAEARRLHEAALAAASQRAADWQAQAGEAAKLRAEFEQQRAADREAWDRERSRLESELAARKKSQAASSGDSTTELTRLRDENKQLEAWLAEAEEKGRSAAAGQGGSQELDDLQRRFEMAVQDVRELKTKNAELAEQLTKSKQGGSAGSSSGAAAAGGDWESMKKRLLAELETTDDNDEQQAADKLTVESAIKITDEVVAHKDDEIRELKRLLDSQSQSVGEVAVGASAIAQMLDGDALVCQERENLLKMQESLREQLKKAEVDISLERAKLARERAELDEKIRAIEAEKSSGEPAVDPATGIKAAKQPARGKWLTRLGLQGKDE